MSGNCPVPETFVEVNASQDVTKNGAVSNGVRWDLAEWLERLTNNVEVCNSAGLGSIPAFSGTVEFEGRQMKQCWIKNYKTDGGS
jgi:hypothetical protein